MYALIKNNQVIEWPIVNLQQRFINVSFPSDVTYAELSEGTVVKVYFSPAPNYNANTQKLVPATTPSFSNDRWEITYTVVSLTPAEQQVISEGRAAAVRADRDTLLLSSDWTQLPDAPEINKAAWATYRQALRDITSQSGFPFNVSWPVKPN